MGDRRRFLSRHIVSTLSCVFGRCSNHNSCLAISMNDFKFFNRRGIRELRKFYPCATVVVTGVVYSLLNYYFDRYRYFSFFKLLSAAMSFANFVPRCFSMMLTGVICVLYASSDYYLLNVFTTRQIPIRTPNINFTGPPLLAISRTK